MANIIQYNILNIRMQNDRRPTRALEGNWKEERIWVDQGEDN